MWWLQCPGLLPAPPTKPTLSRSIPSARWHPSRTPLPLATHSTYNVLVSLSLKSENSGRSTHSLVYEPNPFPMPARCVVPSDFSTVGRNCTVLGQQEDHPSRLESYTIAHVTVLPDCAPSSQNTGAVFNSPVRHLVPTSSGLVSV